MSQQRTLGGRYRLRGVLGVGSFATVYQALDTWLDATVVIKLLAENHSLNPDIRERFIAEGRSIRRVESPHVVTVHDVGQTEQQQPYLVLNYATKGNLAVRVQELRARDWKASPEDILAVAYPLSEALLEVHRQNLVHRDLSPRNLLIDGRPWTRMSHREAGFPPEHEKSQVLGEDERLLLADLGICKDLALNSGLTVAGGTSGFRPPEQERPGTVDTRADIWAASAVLAWLSDGSELPQNLRDAIAEGMQNDPGCRPQTIDSWLENIVHALPATEQGAWTPRTEIVDEYPSSTAAFAEIEAAQHPKDAEKRPFGLNLRLQALVASIALAFGITVGVVAGVVISPSTSGNIDQASSEMTIQGPENIAVGDQATFSVEAGPIRDVVWVLPTGKYAHDEHAVNLVASTPGSAKVVVRAITDDGLEVQATHEFTVHEE